MHHVSQSPRRNTRAEFKDGERPVNRSLDDAVSQAFTRMLSRDVAALVRSARQLSGYVRDDVLRGDIDAAMQALGLLDVRLAGLDRFVAEYLRYQRAGQRQPRVEHFGLGALAETTFRRLGAPPGATLAVNADADCVQADRPLAAEVLHEVLHNAFVHHPEPALLAVVVDIAAGADGRVEVVVSDNGAGIPEGAASRVFEPFVKLSGESGRCGLGLAWCRRALGAAGGYITLREADRGACLVIGLPVGSLSKGDVSVGDGGAPDDDASKPRLRLV